MSAPTAPSAFMVCIDAARRGSSAMLGDVLTDVRLSLQRRADQSSRLDERGNWLEALAELVREQTLLQDRFPKILEDEIRQAIDGGGKRGGAGLSLASLELMDGDQVLENVETARAQQAAAEAVEAQLGQLNALICAAQGLPRVQLDRNPLRPEVYMRSLRQTLLQTQAPAHVRMRWMQAFGEHMGPRLAITYDELTDLLRSQGVGAASYRVINQATATTSGRPVAATGPSTVLEAPPPAQPVTANRASAWLATARLDLDTEAAMSAARAREAERPDFVDTSPNAAAVPALDLPPIWIQKPRAAEDANHKAITLARLHELLSGDPAAGAAPQPEAFPKRTGIIHDRVPAADFSETVPAAFEALEEMGAVDDLVQRVALRQAKGDDASSPRSVAAPVQARSPSQALALEVAGVMLEQWEADTRLLPPVRAAIDELRPALMRLALADPRFFSDKKHPARMLLDSITQQSLAWTSETDSGFRTFMFIVRSTVELVLHSKVEGSDPFAYALESFETALRDRALRDRRRRESAARAMSRLTERQRLAEGIGDDLAGRALRAGVPSTIGLFLKGPWAHVIAEARMQGPASRRDPAVYEEVVTNLLWTTKVSTAATQTSRLARVVPGLTSLLREGLQTIRYSQSKVEEFLKTLGDLHQAALLAAATSRSPEEAAQAIDDGPAYDGVWMEESGLMTLDFEDTAPPTERTTLFDKTAPQALDEGDSGPKQPGGLADILVPGTWVVGHMSGNSLRLRCHGPTMAEGTTYGFTSADGVDHTLTTSVLQGMYERGELTLAPDAATPDQPPETAAEPDLPDTVHNAA